MYFFKNEFVNKKDILLSPDDRGYYFGDGIYEVFRVYHGKIYEQAAHMQRLQRTASDVRIELPFQLKKWVKFSRSLLKRMV